MAQRMLARRGTGERGGKQFAAETRHRTPFRVSSRVSDDADVN